MKYYDNNISDIYKELKSSANGISNSEADKLMAKYGKNELPKAKKQGIIGLFFSQFKDPMEIILIITVFLSFWAKETVDAIALIVIILVDVCIGTYEEWKSRKDAEALVNMIRDTSIVIRDGQRVEIDSSMIVPGDILVLESGKRISADGRIIDCHNFQVDESTLTGESISVVKNSEVIHKECIISEQKNMVFAGTSVVTGRAHVIVTTTGKNTQIGQIAEKIATTEEEKSPLTIRTEKFSKQISVLILIVGIIVAFVLRSRGYELGELFISVVALVVSAMPEGLSLALTMALTIASKRMAKKNVIVKKLNSVESLGSCTVIASDKTGTLTVNEQTAKKIVLADNSTYLISGTGYNDDGEITAVDATDISKVKNIALLGMINNEASLNFENNEWKYFGDSIDIAFLSLAKKAKVVSDYKIVDVIPYESENKYSAVFYEKDGELYCTVKGSLEVVMNFSENNKKYIKQNENLSNDGYRVIAIADGKVKGTSVKDIKKLNFVGLVGFIDPIRTEAKDSIKECNNAGIKVVMITGDFSLTAFAIGKELGLCTCYDDVATGEELARYKALGEKEYDNFVKSKTIFSRVSPLDKLDIVNSFKRQGEFIAVTGDGVNDAPAIKAANIGISMGSGTDVAKETASMIVVDDNFTSIVAGVKEGRCAFSNIRKICLFLLGCGFAEVSFYLLSIFFGYAMPMTAIQLLWLNMITDGLQDVALSFEVAEKNIMKQKPRRTDESLFSKDLAIEVLIIGLTITIVVFSMWKWLMDNNFDIVVSRSVIMMLMVFIQNINVLNCRSEKRSVLTEPIKNNILVPLVIIGSIGLQIILAEVPITAKFLELTPLNWKTVVGLLVLSFVIIGVFEFYKLIYKKVYSSKK